MTSGRLAPTTVAFALTLALGWALAGGCGGRSLNAPGGGAGASGHSGAAGSAGSGAAGATTSSAAGATTSGAAGATTSGAAGADTSGAAGADSSGAAGAATSGAAGAATSGTGGSTTSGAAGVTGAAGASAAGATGQAGSGQAGSPGQGGQAGGCGPCPAIACGEGFMSVVDPAISCCPICRPLDCTTALCANPICPAGTHSEVPKGSCCAVCMMGVSQACNQAQDQYNRDRKQFLDKYGSSRCAADAECRLVFEDNACESNCGEALPVSTANLFESNIQADADKCDGVCPALSGKPDCTPLVPVCSNGLCVALPAAR
jgi:hypothetical protein